MARFDVFKNPGNHSATTPYLLDVQSDLLDLLDTRVVIPMRRQDAFPDVKLPADLVPLFTFDGVPCLLETPKMAAVPTRALKSPIGSLADQRDLITSALDRLFYGF